MAFIELRFPVDVSYGSAGGPEFRTDVVDLASGFDERNSRWSQARRRYNGAVGVRSEDDLYLVISHFQACHGKLHGFRWKDFSDFKSVGPGPDPTNLDQAIGTGDGSTATFQLIKTYTVGAQSHVRTIVKPVSGTVLVAVAGAGKTLGVHFNVNTATGVITFTGGNIPTLGQAVTAGFEFDVPVRYDTDYLNSNWQAFRHHNAPNIPIVETRRFT